MPKKKFSAPKAKKTAEKADSRSAKNKNDNIVKSLAKKNKPELAKKSSVAKTLALPRGMRDILPKSQDKWLKIYHACESITKSYGFNYIETPIVENTSLFVRSIGKGTDVVDKEMYNFEDNDGSKVCLRPETTAAVARAYIMHGMHTLSQPVKVWNWGPMFRHDRPQAGRYREFHQFSCETLGGEHAPIVDAELISIAYNVLRDLGINTTVRINSIGTLEEREQYIIELVGYLRSKRSYLSELSKKRIIRNPLRVLDSKEPEDFPVIEEAPQIIDWLTDSSKNFFTKVLEYLDEVEIPYILTPTLVRGLDYYTDTVFEIYEEGAEEESQGSLVGGGRYDGLIGQLGGQPAYGSGFSLGVERVLSVLQRKAKDDGTVSVPKPAGGIFFAQLGEQAQRRALRLVEMLRRDGIFMHHNLTKSSLKAQLELANKLGVSHALILGQKEVQDDTILVRNMESGIQEVVDQKKLKLTLKKIIID